MKKSIFLSIAVAFFTILNFSFTSSAPANDKITICHIPPGNPANCHEITISVNALETHREHHGDRLFCRNQSNHDFVTNNPELLANLSIVHSH